MHILQNKVDVVITDSPIILSLLYADKCLKPNILNDFTNLSLNIFNEMDNLNIFLNRIKVYNPHGRMQTESEANELSRKNLDYPLKLLRRYCPHHSGYQIFETKIPTIQNFLLNQKSISGSFEKRSEYFLLDQI